MRLSKLAIVAAASTLVALSVQAQAVAAPKTSVISIQPLSAIFGVYAVEYEHAIAPTVTFGIGGSYWSDDTDGSELKYSSGDIKLRFYPEGRPLQGFSFGGQAGYTSITDRSSADTFSGGTGSKSTAHGPTIGVALDYNWLLGATKSFYVGLGVGAKKIFANADDLGSANLAYPTGRISIGFAF